MYKIALILHILGACVWVGGHLVLTLGLLPKALRAKRPEVVLEFESVFERIGIPALATQVVTGLFLAQQYIPSPKDWFAFENHLQTHIFAKLMLLALTVVFALEARVRLIPHLQAKTMGRLAIHIVVVTILAVLFAVVGVGFRVGGVF